MIVVAQAQIRCSIHHDVGETAGSRAVGHELRETAGSVAWGCR
jgi:hypothetical protein